ncbi:hypothetical protein ACNI3T_11250 [Christiangramia sp. ASW11-125]|uniref:hypothetical protein n=1 Tax=Christiangramia sp. ASW11-125 TaxID=3400701 RepID=UPI003AACE2A3
MKKTLLFLIAIFTVINVSSQELDLNGKWIFEDISSEKEIDEKGKKMAEMMFEGMYLAFDSNKYQQSMMGKIENGNWLEDEDGIFFISSKGYEYQVSIKELSEDRILFILNDMSLKLKRTESDFEIPEFVDNLDKIKGIEIDEKLLAGKWNWVETIKKNGDSAPAIKHSKTELTSYNFKDDRSFENKAPFGMELFGYWQISDDLNYLIVQSENKNEYFKVLKLEGKFLELYNPKNESILKFEQEN